MTLQAPWYTFGRIDNFGVYPDPVGPYAKPDSNIMVPAGTPITALASGTVTGARSQPWGPLADSITIAMDQPFNNVATHTAYNYVSNMQVHVGQHVNAGDTIAYAGNPYGIGTAFAFTDASVYGQGTANEPFSGSYINPALDPTAFLNGVAAGKNVLGDVGGLLNGSNLSSMAQNVNNPQTNTFLGFDFTKFFDALLLFIVGITLLIVGGMLIMNKGFSMPSVKATV